MELNYDKDSKERIPYEHYMELYRQADPREISGRCGIPYDEEKQEFCLRRAKICDYRRGYSVD